MEPTPYPRHQVQAYVLVRLLLGFSFLMHGVNRFLSGLPAFRDGLVQEFADTPLPTGLVSGFGYVLPVVEFLVGALLVLGAFTRWALLAAGVIVAALVFGASLVAFWEGLVSQLLHGALAAWLLWHLPANGYSLDSAARRKR